MVNSGIAETNAFDLKQIQAAIREFGFDGWLLYDFRGMNVLALRVLGLSLIHI